MNLIHVLCPSGDIIFSKIEFNPRKIKPFYAWYTRIFVIQRCKAHTRARDKRIMVPTTFIKYHWNIKGNNLSLWVIYCSYSWID